MKKRFIETNKFIILTSVIAIFLGIISWSIAVLVFPPPACASEIGTLRPTLREVIALIFFALFFGIYAIAVAEVSR